MEDAAVAQFTEITGSGPEVAAQYLELTDYNVETAMQLFFENGGAPITTDAPQQPSQATESRRSGYEDESGVVHIDSDSEGHDPAAPRPATTTQPNTSGAADTTFEDDAAMARRLQEELYGGGDNFGGGGGGDGFNEVDDDGVRAPMARTTETLVGPGADVFDDDPLHGAALRHFHHTRPGRAGRPGIFNQQDVWRSGDDSSSLSQATGGASETSSKSNMLAEMYRPPFELMCRLPWDMARDEGREQEKWLLVNIQDPSVFDCQVLNRDLWKNPSIVDTIKEHFIFLQYTKDDPRGAPYVQYYFHGHNVQDNYPHIAIVDPRTGEQMKVWSGPPVAKASEFLMQLHEFLDRYSLNHNVRNPVARRKPEVPKEKKIEAMTEEEMMEMALKNSLAGQVEGASKQEDPDDLTRSVGDVKGKGRATDVDSDAEMVELEDEATASPFKSIPSDKPHVEPTINDPATTTRIQFRHPSGRVIRRFNLSDSVQRIYEWLKASPLEGKEGVEFDLVSMGQNLIDQRDSTIQDAGLKNGTVMIGFVEED